MQLHVRQGDVLPATPMSSPSPNALPSFPPGESAPAARSTVVEVNPAEVLPWLPCTVSLDIPLSHFTIGDLSKLGTGSVVTSACRHLSDIPLYVNGQLIGWTEFEVIDDRLAVRITELA